MQSAGETKRREPPRRSTAALSLFLAGGLLVASPRRVLADKIEKKYQHAAELLRQGDLERAASDFEEILRAKPDHTKAKILLGVTHFQLGQKAGENGDGTRAILEVREALRLEPDEAYWHSALAKLLNEQGDPEGAAKECAQAAELSPDDSGLASGCGLAKSVPPEGGPKSENFAVGKGFTAPIPTYKPEPSYTEKARSVWYQGTTVAWIVVNAQGSVEHAMIVKPLGLGLDQMALQKVLTWKFTPATRNGVPVPARLSVEIAFRLF